MTPERHDAGEENVLSLSRSVAVNFDLVAWSAHKKRGIPLFQLAPALGHR